MNIRCIYLRSQCIHVRRYIIAPSFACQDYLFHVEQCSCKRLYRALLEDFAGSEALPCARYLHTHPAHVKAGVQDLV